MSTPPAATSPLCFLDTETDSTGPDRQVWEVGAIRREPDGEETTYHAFLDIDTGRSPDGFGLRIGRFHERHPLGRRVAQLPVLGDPAAADPRYLAQLELTPAPTAAISIAQITHGAHIIGAVPSFDTFTLERLLREHELLPMWHYHLGDVENLAVGYLAARGKVLLPPWSSSELTDLLGVDQGADEEKHTALGDCRWAMRMWDAIMAGGAA